MAAVIKRRFREYQSGFINIIAFLGEARIREYAVNQVDFFIEGPEGSENDAAIFVGPETLQTREGAANTFFVELGAYERKNVLAALDVKCLAAKCDSKIGTFFKIHLQPGQRRTCKAVIGVSPKEPDFVLVIPVHYLPETNKNDTLDLPAVRPLWTLHPIPAFPSEYTAFVTPVAQLGRRLENMRAYFNQSKNAWGNEYTGVHFTGVPPPRLSNKSVLQPTIQHAGNALERLRRYFTAFHECSKRFRFDLVGVRPFGGDFKIIEISTKQEVFVELKDGLMEVIRDTGSGLQVLRHRALNPLTHRSIFTWKAQWDYLLSSDRAQEYAYFFPRDKIPADWWDRDGVQEMREGFQEYRIDLGQRKSIVRDIEKVLDRTQAETGSLRARYVRPVRPMTAEPLQQIGDHWGLGDTGPVGRYTWSTTGFRRGFGSAQHGELRGDTYGQWASEVLIELCRASGEAMILDFGAHNPKCRFAIVRYRWSEMDRVRYDRDGEPPVRVWNFPNNTPVVPLTFLRVSWTGEYQSKPGTDSVTRIKEFESRVASLVIFDLYPGDCLRMSHHRFVCASEHVKSKVDRNVRGVVQEGLLERFIVSSDNLIKVMTAPLRGDAEIVLGSAGDTIRATDYCHFIQDFHQAGVEAL